MNADTHWPLICGAFAAMGFNEIGWPTGFGMLSGIALALACVLAGRWVSLHQDHAKPDPEVEL